MPRVVIKGTYYHKRTHAQDLADKKHDSDGLEINEFIESLRSDISEKNKHHPSFYVLDTQIGLRELINNSIESVRKQREIDIANKVEGVDRDAVIPITVEIEETDDTFTIRIMDEGTGVPLEWLQDGNGKLIVNGDLQSTKKGESDSLGGGGKGLKQIASFAKIYAGEVVVTDNPKIPKNPQPNVDDPNPTSPISTTAQLTTTLSGLSISVPDSARGFAMPLPSRTYSARSESVLPPPAAPVRRTLSTSSSSARGAVITITSPAQPKLPEPSSVKNAAARKILDEFLRSPTGGAYLAQSPIPPMPTEVVATAVVKKVEVKKGFSLLALSSESKPTIDEADAIPVIPVTNNEDSDDEIPSPKASSPRSETYSPRTFSPKPATSVAQTTSESEEVTIHPPRSPSRSPSNSST